MPPTPRIGLTTYGRNGDNRFTLPAEYVESVRRAGGIPVLLPPGETRIAEWFAWLDAVILPGGGDIAPSRYRGTDHAQIYNLDPERDADELELAQRVLDSGLPTLAICRGMQILNVALGGSLIEHLPDVVGDAVAHRAADRGPVPHAIQITAGSAVARVLGTTDTTPISMHHQAVREVAPGFDVVGHAPDGTIEAMEMPSHPWLLAVQWHPELTAAEDSVQQRLFDELVSIARTHAS